MEWPARLVFLQASLAALLCSWAQGGRDPCALRIAAFLGWAALVPLAFYGFAEWRRNRERARLLCLREKRGKDGSKGRPARVFLFLWPWVALLVYLGVALANPVYEAVSPPDAGAVYKKIEYISFLPRVASRAEAAEKTAFLTGALVLALAFYYTAGRRSWRALLLLLYANGLVLTFAGTAEALVFPSAAPGRDSDGAFAGFRYHNHWAAFALLLIAAAWALAGCWRRGGQGKRGRVFWLLPASAFFPALTIPLCGSRGGTALLLLMACLWLGSRFRFWIRGAAARAGSGKLSLPRALTAVLAVAGVLLLLAERPLSRRWHDTRLQWRQWNDSGLAELRIYSAEAAWDMALASPWLGWGLGSFGLLAPHFAGGEFERSTYTAAWRLEFAHNDWLQYWAELGAAGFLLLLSVPAGAAARVVRRRKGLTAAGPLAAGCGLICLWAAWDFPLSNPAVLIHFALFYAVIAAAGLAPPEDGPRGAVFSKRSSPLPACAI